MRFQFNYSQPTCLFTLPLLGGKKVGRGAIGSISKIFKRRVVTCRRLWPFRLADNVQTDSP
jgi:hypothetical protein